MSLIGTACSSSAAPSTSTPPSSRAAPPGPTTSVAAPATIGTLESVVCTSSADCTAIGTSGGGGGGTPVVATTSDGGIGWARHGVPASIWQLSGLACASSASCVAVGRSFPGTDNLVPGRAVYTVDGGTVWNSSEVPRGSGTISDVSCPAPTLCLAVGATPDGGGGIALRSTDAGRSWERSGLPPGERSLALVACRSTTDCTAIGGGQSGTGSTSIGTTDGGGSWTATTVPTGSAAAGPLVATGVSCPSPTTCFLSGEQAVPDGNPTGSMYRTSDAGRSWTGQSLPSGTGSLSDVSCSSPTTCVAVGGGIPPRGGDGVPVVLRTTDGGAEWVPEAAPASAGGLFGVSCPSADVCVAVGETPPGTANVVARTTDGGVTWTGAAA